MSFGEIRALHTDFMCSTVYEIEITSFESTSF